MDRFRKFTIPLFFLVLFSAGIIFYKIQSYVPGEVGEWESVDLICEERENGWKTYLPGIDVYTFLLEEDVYIIGGAEGLFFIDPQKDEARHAQGLRYVFALLREDEDLYRGYDGG